MFCPLENHRMVEIAQDLYQCPKCGAGPRLSAPHSYWALFSPVIEDGIAEALCTMYVARGEHKGEYVVTGVTWEVNQIGKAKIGSLKSELIEYLSSPSELRTGLLPVISQSGSGCSSALTFRMFDPEGPKVI